MTADSVTAARESLQGVLDVLNARIEALSPALSALFSDCSRRLSELELAQRKYREAQAHLDRTEGRMQAYQTAATEVSAALAKLDTAAEPVAPQPDTLDPATLAQ